MKNKLIASIVALTVIGGTVTPTFAATNEATSEKENRCSISGSLLQELTFKKVWWGNCSGGVIIIGGTVDNPNNNENDNNNDDNSNNVTPPTEDTETPDVPNNPSIDETPGDTVIPPTEEPSTTDEPTVDETPNAPEEEPSIPEETPNTPVVDETPDNSTEDGVTDEDTNFMVAVETAIFNKVNEERAKAGVTALTYNTTMQKYARIKSQDMGDNNYFSHEDLNGNLITTQMKNDGVSYKAWGENIAYISGNLSADALAEQFMTQWMNSSGHRANILSTNFSSIGVGVYKIGNKVYATQEFYR